MSGQINTTDLVDISSVRVDSSLPKQERMTEYVRQIKKPLHFMCLGYEITSIHAEDGPPLEDCLERIIK
jgi:hypothetical protein